MNSFIRNIFSRFSESSPQRLWTILVWFSLVLFILGLLHAGFIFWQYGSRVDAALELPPKREVMLNVDELYKVTATIDFSTTTPGIVDPFLREEE